MVRLELLAPESPDFEIIAGAELELVVRLHNESGDTVRAGLEVEGLPMDWYGRLSAIGIESFEHRDLALRLRTPELALAEERNFTISVRPESLEIGGPLRLCAHVVGLLAEPAGVPHKREPEAEAETQVPPPADLVSPPDSSPTLPQKTLESIPVVHEENPVRPKPVQGPKQTTRANNGGAQAAKGPWAGDSPKDEDRIPQNTPRAGERQGMVPQQKPEDAPVQSDLEQLGGSTTAGAKDAQVTPAEVEELGMKGARGPSIEAPQPLAATMPNAVRVQQDAMTQLSADPGAQLDVLFPFTNQHRTDRLFRLTWDTRSLDSTIVVTTRRDQVLVPTQAENDLHLCVATSTETKPKEYFLTAEVGPIPTDKDPSPAYTQYVITLTVNPTPQVSVNLAESHMSAGPIAREVEFKLEVENAGNSGTAYRLIAVEPEGKHAQKSGPRPTSGEGPYELVFDRELDELSAPAGDGTTTCLTHGLRVRRKPIWWWGWVSNVAVTATAVPVTDVSNNGKGGNSQQATAKFWRILPFPWQISVPLGIALLIGSGGGVPHPAFAGAIKMNADVALYLPDSPGSVTVRVPYRFGFGWVRQSSQALNGGQERQGGASLRWPGSNELQAKASGQYGERVSIEASPFFGILGNSRSAFAYVLPAAQSQVELGIGVYAGSSLIVGAPVSRGFVSPDSQGSLHLSLANPGSSGQYEIRTVKVSLSRARSLQKQPGKLKLSLQLTNTSSEEKVVFIVFRKSGLADRVEGLFNETDPNVGWIDAVGPNETMNSKSAAWTDPQKGELILATNQPRCRFLRLVVED